MKYGGNLTPEAGQGRLSPFQKRNQSDLPYGKVERVPNVQFNPGFATEKFIFLTKMRMHEESP